MFVELTFSSGGAFFRSDARLTFAAHNLDSAQDSLLECGKVGNAHRKNTGFNMVLCFVVHVAFAMGF